MKPARAYASAAAFRRALEDRLARLSAQQATDLSRLQKRVAFERLLARLFPEGEKQRPPWLLKGGYALEMRLRHTARATKDIDLTVPDAVALGLEPAAAEMVPLTVHFAEKLHAYTCPRAGTSNSRVRDLADMVLLIQLGLCPDEALRAAVEATFARRATHLAPGVVPPPPAEWSPTYAQIAVDIRLGIDDATAAHRLIADFWERAALP